MVFRKYADRVGHPTLSLELLKNLLFVSGPGKHEKLVTAKFAKNGRQGRKEKRTGGTNSWQTRRCKSVMAAKLHDVLKLARGELDGLPGGKENPAGGDARGSI